jgi:hypothetical protein
MLWHRRGRRPKLQSRRGPRYNIASPEFSYRLEELKGNRGSCARERGDQRLRLGRIEPERRERNVDSPDQLILRPRRAGDRGSPRNEARRGRGDEVAARQGETIARRPRRCTTVMEGIHSGFRPQLPFRGLAVNLTQAHPTVSPPL